MILMGGKMSEKDAKDDMIKAFKLFDSEGTGRITFKNLEAVAKELNDNATKADLQGMIAEADTDGSGDITESEFLAVMKAVSLY